MPLPPTLVETFDTQLDLRSLPGVNSAVRVYENTEWVPLRAAAVSGFDDGIDSIDDLQINEIGSNIGVFVGSGDTLYGGIPAQTELFVAQTPDDGWTFTVDGTPAALPR